MSEAHGEMPLWGVSAEFADPTAMIAALGALRGRGLRRLDAHSPMPLPQAADSLPLHRWPITAAAVIAALVGGAATFGVCAYAGIWGYRLDIGGRPLFSWPAFLVPAFSVAMLAGSLASLFALLLLNRLPRLNHPAFNIPDILRATSDRCFLAVEARDAAFDPDAVERALADLPQPPLRISRVPR